MRNNFDHPFRRPLTKSSINKGAKRHSADAFLYNHKIWALFCEDQDECDDFVLMPDCFFEEYEYMDCAASAHMKMEVMSIGDFIVLHNMEDENVTYIGRVAKIGPYEGKETFYNYSCQIEWAELDPIECKLPCDEYTENPVLITPKDLIAKWRKVILEEIVG